MVINILRVINLLIWASLWWYIWNKNGQTTNLTGFLGEGIIPIVVFLFIDYSLRGYKHKDIVGSK
jgi:hypothetical protein